MVSSLSLIDPLSLSLSSILSLFVGIVFLFAPFSVRRTVQQLQSKPISGTLRFSPKVYSSRSKPMWNFVPATESWWWFWLSLLRRWRHPWFWVNCREIFTNREREFEFCFGEIFYNGSVLWLGFFFFCSGGYLFCYFAIMVYDCDFQFLFFLCWVCTFFVSPFFIFRFLICLYFWSIFFFW